MIKFPANFLLLSFLAGLTTTALLLPFWKRFCVRFQLVDDPGVRKIHTQTTPLAGGLAIFSGLLLPILFGAVFLFSGTIFDQSNLLIYGFKRRVLELVAIIFGGAMMLAT